MLFSPDLHLLSAMFEVMPEDEQGDELLGSILRLVDRSARNEQVCSSLSVVERECELASCVVRQSLTLLRFSKVLIHTENPELATLTTLTQIYLNTDIGVQIMKACVEMEVANTLDASTMFRRNNMSLRILKMHLNKVGAGFLRETLRPCLLRFRDVVDQRRAAGCSMELDPNLLTPADNLRANVTDLSHHVAQVFEEVLPAVVLACLRCAGGGVLAVPLPPPSRSLTPSVKHVALEGVVSDRVM